MYLKEITNMFRKTGQTLMLAIFETVLRDLSNISKFRMKSNKSSKKLWHGFTIKILIWPLDKAKDPVQLADVLTHAWRI